MTESVDSLYELHPGQRVQTKEGYPGKVNSVEHAPGGGTQYDVTLDGGKGGGQYDFSELTPIKASVSKDADRADKFYPELGDLLHRKPPPRHSMPVEEYLSGLITGADALYGAVTAATEEDEDPAAATSPPPPEAEKPAKVEAVTKEADDDGWLSDTLRGKPSGEYVNFDWCRFRHNQHCNFPHFLNVQPTVQKGSAVWNIEDRGFCPRDWNNQTICPIGEPGPNANTMATRAARYLLAGDGGDHAGSAMVALPLPPEIANKISVPDGVPADQMHVTLAYLESPSPEDLQKVHEIAEQHANTMPKINASVGGLGQFPAGEDGVPYYAPVDAPGDALPALQASLATALKAAGIEVAEDHGFTAHSTLTYLPEGNQSPDPVEPQKFQFPGLVVAEGPKWTHYPFGGRDDETEATEDLQDLKAAALDSEVLDFILSVGGTATMTEPDYITREEARGNSRPVSKDEFRTMADEGRQMLDTMHRGKSPITGLDDNWERLKAHSWGEVQKPWGGATIDSHTGVPLESNADKYALTVKPSGMNSVSVPENTDQNTFYQAMEHARDQFRPLLENQQYHLGVFHDDDNKRIDLDPVLVVNTPEEVEKIGAQTHAIGGAYHFRSGDGYWPPHVADGGEAMAHPEDNREGARKEADYVDEEERAGTFKGPGHWRSQAEEVQPGYEHQLPEDEEQI